MAKKSKKFDAETEGTTEGTTEVSTPTEPKAPAIPKARTFFLRDEDSTVEYKFDKRLSLPKKAAVIGQVTIDGQPSDLQVTSNKGFTMADTVIAYSWLTLPDGSMGYITHDYGVNPEAGASYSLHEGKANRDNPARVPKDDVVSTLRVEKFKATMDAKKATEQSATEPTDAVPA